MINSENNYAFACGEIGVISKGINEFFIDYENVLLILKGAGGNFGVTDYDKGKTYYGNSRSISSLSSIKLRIYLGVLLK